MNYATTKAILEAAHAAWSVSDVEGLLGWYADDIVYCCNMGGPNGGEPMTIVGKDAMRAFLAPVLDVADSVSVLEDYQFANGVGRAQVSCFIKHKVTRHVLSGTYRQTVSFRRDRISRLEEFHDAAKTAAFWRLVSSEAPVKTR